MRGLSLSLSLAVAAGPPVAIEDIPLQVWAGGDRPSDLTPIEPGTVDLAVPSTLAGFAVQIPYQALASANNACRIRLRSDGYYWLQLSTNSAGTNTVFAYKDDNGTTLNVATGITPSGTNPYFIGFLRTGAGSFRAYVRRGAVHYSRAIADISPEGAYDSIGVNWTNVNSAGGLFTAQEWFKGTPVADAYPTTNIVEDYVNA